MKMPMSSFLAGLACIFVVSSAVSLRGPGPIALHLASNSSSAASKLSHAEVTNETTRSYCKDGGECLSYTGVEEDVTEDFPWQYNVSEFAYSLKAEVEHLQAARSSANGTQDAGAAPNLCIDGKLVPSFYLLGAQKCATSSFAHELAKAKNVVLPEMASWNGKQRNLFRKELHFFDYPDRYNHGKPFWLQHFPQCPSTHMVAADFTPSYLSTWEAPNRLKQMYGIHSGRLTFLIILREPLARMQSSYYHGISGSWVSKQYGSFELYADWAVWKYHHGQYRKFHDCRAKSVDADFTSYTGVPFSLSLYKDQIANWLQYFSPQQFMVAPFKAYVKPASGNKLGLVKSVASWRGIDAKIPPQVTNPQDVPRLNVHSHPSVEADLKPETYRMIKQVFELATGPAKLAELLSPAMTKGLRLYGYKGTAANKGWIASYIQNSW